MSENQTEYRDVKVTSTPTTAATGGARRAPSPRKYKAHPKDQVVSATSWEEICQKIDAVLDAKP